MDPPGTVVLTTLPWVMVVTILVPLVENWRVMSKGKEVFQRASCRIAKDDNAKPLVSPSRAVVGLPPLA
jgi:hypothetical protein